MRQETHEVLHKAKTRSGLILREQEINPGWNHTETLQTLMFLVVIEVALCGPNHRSEKVLKIVKDLFFRLDDRTSEQQCLVQNSRLLEKLFRLLKRLPLYADEADEAENLLGILSVALNQQQDDEADLGQSIAN